MPTRKTDSWIIIAVRVNPPAAEAVSAYLLEASPAGIETVDASHPTPPPDLPDDRIEIRAYFPPGTEPAGQVEALEKFCRRAGTCVPGFACDPPRTTPLSPEDWADGWKKHFKPVRVGRFFIHPGWIEPIENETHPVRIDPSLAFGTGLHPRASWPWRPPAAACPGWSQSTTTPRPAGWHGRIFQRMDCRTMLK
jgi:ribosomal protein L11 methyltransferase